MRISKIYEPSSEDFKKACEGSSSLKEILGKLGLSFRGHSYDILKQRIKEEGIRFETNSGSKGINYKDIQAVLCINSPYVSSNALKKRLISEGILINICSECGSLPIHNEKPLVLQLDHVNGEHTDNRLENLQILCPNCHSQTSTYSGKNSKTNEYRKSNKIIKDKKHKEQLPENSVKLGGSVLKICELQILAENNYYDDLIKMLNVDGKTLRKVMIRHGISYKVRQRKRKFEVAKEELEKLIDEKPLREIGKMYGVGANAIKKRCNVLGIFLENRLGYWSKKKKQEKMLKTTVKDNYT